MRNFWSGVFRSTWSFRMSAVRICSANLDGRRDLCQPQFAERWWSFVLRIHRRMMLPDTKQWGWRAQASSSIPCLISWNWIKTSCLPPKNSCNVDRVPSLRSGVDLCWCQDLRLYICILRLLVKHFDASELTHFNYCDLKLLNGKSLRTPR